MVSTIVYFRNILQQKFTTSYFDNYWAGVFKDGHGFLDMRKLKTA